MDPARRAELVTGRPLAIRVESYAGHRAEETPRRFSVGDRTVEVVDVLDRWVAPDHRYFKLKGDDGDTYIIRQDTAADVWELTVYARQDRL
jgi:hypothetical protein